MPRICAVLDSSQGLTISCAAGRPELATMRRRYPTRTALAQKLRRQMYACSRVSSCRWVKDTAARRRHFEGRDAPEGRTIKRYGTSEPAGAPVSREPTIEEPAVVFQRT